VRQVIAVLLVGVFVGPTRIALGSGDPSACRVRNVTQGTVGGSLVRAVRMARDGDRLSVRGTREGGVTIRADLRIFGAAASRAVLTGMDAHRVLRVAKGATVTLRHLVLAHGRADGRFGTGAVRSGGAVLNRGTLTIIQAIVRDSRSDQGGGIANHGGMLTLVGSVVRDDVAHSGGAGVLNDAEGTVIVVRSVIRGNRTAQSMGGGVLNDGTLTITGSSVTQNTPDDCVGTDAC
jgi:hypothetical protein